jgi:hypothetical protein
MFPPQPHQNTDPAYGHVTSFRPIYVESRYNPTPVPPPPPPPDGSSDFVAKDSGFVNMQLPADFMKVLDNEKDLKMVQHAYYVTTCRMTDIQHRHMVSLQSNAKSFTYMVDGFTFDVDIAKFMDDILRHDSTAVVGLFIDLEIDSSPLCVMVRKSSSTHAVLESKKEMDIAKEALFPLRNIVGHDILTKIKNERSVRATIEHIVHTLQRLNPVETSQMKIYLTNKAKPGHFNLVIEGFMCQIDIFSISTVIGLDRNGMIDEVLLNPVERRLTFVVSASRVSKTKTKKKTTTGTGPAEMPPPAKPARKRSHTQTFTPVVYTNGRNSVPRLSVTQSPGTFRGASPAP